MRILHTSDWHIGKRLCGKNRYEEFGSFFTWLVETIKDSEIEALLVAGDIFDTTTPSNKAQEIYYQFLRDVSMTSCRHIVITAGNHDSPSFLNAPKELLKILNVHVVGSVPDDIGEEVLILNDKNNRPELIVCAVPYLRDRDIRTVEAGESVEDKAKNLIKGITEHYRVVGSIAEKRRYQLGKKIPIVGMGHLFTVKGQVTKDDGVRDLYVGTLAHVPADAFPKYFDYTALGHLHIPQTVAGLSTIRYSGSPLKMGFGESSKTEKSVCIVDMDDTDVGVELIQVPTFQRIESIMGNWDEIAERLAELSKTKESIWTEVVYQGEEIISNLSERVNEAVEGTKIEVLRIKNRRVVDRIYQESYAKDKLDDLSVEEVFESCLIINDVPEEQRQVLRDAYNEILLLMAEEDIRAE